MRLALAGFFASVLLLLPVAAVARLDRYSDFQSQYVLPRNVTVYVPDDYDPKGARLPVIYMHDGQNLFEAATCLCGKEWGIDEALQQMGKRAIVVGVWNSKERGRDYLPAKPWANLPQGTRDAIAAFHGGAPKSDGYLRFLVKELKPFIDKHYRTRRDARSTSIMGSSMGGLISLYAMGEYPNVFGAAAAVSIHWPLAKPGIASPDEVAAGFDQWLVTTRLKPGRNRLYIDHGTQNLDSYYGPFREKMEAVFAAHGWKPGVDFTSKVIDGGDHNEPSWNARVPSLLTFLLEPATR